MRPITIVIPTYNRALSLETVWPSYSGHPQVEKIVVVNDGSTDMTSTLLKKLANTSPTPLEIIEHSTRQGQQSCRMDGVAATQTEWLLFGEDDVAFESTYITNLYNDAQRLGADVIAGRLIPLKTDKPPETVPTRPSGEALRNGPELFDLRTFTATYEAAFAEPTPAPFLHAVALIRTRVFRSSEFDSRYRGSAHREETDFYLSAAANGAALYFTPNAVAYHLRNPSSNSGGTRRRSVSYCRAEWWGIINTYLLLRKHWSFLRSRYGLRGSPIAYTLKYYIPSRLRRLIDVLQDRNRLYTR